MDLNKYNILDYLICFFHSLSFLMLILIVLLNIKKSYEQLAKKIFFIIAFFRLIKNFDFIIVAIIKPNNPRCMCRLFFDQVSDVNTFFGIFMIGISILFLMSNFSFSLSAVEFIRQKFNLIFGIVFLISICFATLTFYTNDDFRIHHQLCIEKGSIANWLKSIYFSLFLLMALIFVCSMIMIIKQHNENQIELLFSQSQENNSNFFQRIIVIITMISMALTLEVFPYLLPFIVKFSEMFDIYFFRILYALIEAILAFILFYVFDVISDLKGLCSNKNSDNDLNYTNNSFTVENAEVIDELE